MTAQDEFPEPSNPDSNTTGEGASASSRESSHDRRAALEAGRRHRDRVSAWLMQPFAAGQARCVLVGPGAGTHVDLAMLAEHFVELTWVDTDRRIVDQALELQGVAASRVQVLIDPDWLGMNEPIRQLSEQAARERPGFHDVQAAIDAVNQAPFWDMPAKADIVLLAEALPWLASRCFATLGGEHPSLPDWAYAVRVRLLQQVVRLLKPGGYGVVIQQLVNSRIMPSLPKVPQTHWEAVLSELVRERRIPYGADPVALEDLLSHDRHFKELIRDTHRIRPWRFPTGEIEYAMCGLSFQKVAAAEDNA